MKYLILILIWIYSIIYLNAQNMASGIITYRHVINLNSNMARDEVGLTAQLFIKNEKSLYIFNRDTTLKTDDVWFGTVGSFETGYKDLSKDKYGECYFKDLKSNKLIARQFIEKKAYLIDDTLKPIKWKITSESKMIGNYSCQKAEGRFKGRNYTAWFSLAIPYRTGPWKLCGLPGLILEAYDEKKEVAFYCESAKPLMLTNEDVSIVNKGIKVKRLEYRNLQLEFDKKEVQRMLSHSDKNVTISVIGAEVFYDLEMDEN